MACIFSVGIFFISRVMILDLREGVKNVLQGIITRKESYAEMQTATVERQIGSTFFISVRTNWQ